VSWSEGLSRPTSVFDNAEPLLIGAGDLGSNVRDFFDGRIDEVELMPGRSTGNRQHRCRRYLAVPSDEWRRQPPNQTVSPRPSPQSPASKRARTGPSGGGSAAGAGRCPASTGPITIPPNTVTAA
jgi:hypothetical protein